MSSDKPLGKMTVAELYQVAWDLALRKHEGDEKKALKALADLNFSGLVMYITLMRERG